MQLNSSSVSPEILHNRGIFNLYFEVNSFKIISFHT